MEEKQMDDEEEKGKENEKDKQMGDEAITRQTENQPEAQFVPLTAITSPPDELDIPLTEEDIQIVEEFEAKWKEFLEATPSLIPFGKRGERVAQLRKEVNETIHQKAAVEAELEAQLQSLHIARDELEESCQRDMTAESKILKEIQDRWRNQLDNVAIADHQGSMVIPWNHFMHAVDTASSQDDLLKDKHVRPSARAYALADNSSDPSDVEMRSYRIDHALLSAQVNMLEKEVQCYEKTAESLAEVAQIFTESNIWSIITKTAH